MTDTKNVDEEPVPVPSPTDFNTYVWEEDEEWLILVRRLEFPPHFNDEQKQKYLMKRKQKYFKLNIDPEFEIHSSKKPTTTEDPIINRNNTQNIYENDIKSDENISNQTTNDSKTNENTSSTNNTSSNNTSSNNTSSSNNSSSNNRYPYGRYEPPPTRIGSMIAPFLNIFYLLAQWFILVNSLLSMIHPPCYTYCVLAVGITHVIATVQNCGRPQFAGWYAQLVMKEENTMIAVYAFVLLMGAKHIIFLSPIILRSLFMACYLSQRFFSARLPVSVYGMVKPLLKRVTANSVWFNKSVAMCEVFVGIFLVFACFVMSRTVIMTLIYWQVMQARYMMSGYIRMTFSDLHARISGVLSAVPFVLNLYLKLTGILGNMVDPAVMQQRMEGGGGGISGMVSKMCIVM